MWLSRHTCTSRPRPIQAQITYHRCSGCLQGGGLEVHHDAGTESTASNEDGHVDGDELDIPVDGEIRRHCSHTKHFLRLRR